VDSPPNTKNTASKCKPLVVPALLPPTQFKPVLVNIYKSKPSSSLGDHTPTPEGRPGDSLTEHTLTVITAKVKKMNARSVNSGNTGYNDF